MLRNILFTAVIGVFVISVHAQTTEFTYQGSLKNGGTQANGNFDFEFKLFDLVSAGAQQGSTIQRLNVAVANGIFAVSLDFGTGTLPGADRFLDIAVRTAGGGAFTPLSPRQKVNSAPYSVKSLNAATADTAIDAAQLGGVAANQFVVTTDPRMTDARAPTAGSADYIQNRTTQQLLANFNINGNGTVGGTLRGNIVNATTQYNIGNQRVLSGNSGSGLLFVGQGSGAANTGGFNSFVGINSGAFNTDGFGNSFVGSNAGVTNTTGNQNSFFGSFAGLDNDTGFSNSFFGYNAGRHNTGSVNSFFGSDAGSSNTTGGSNAFFGNSAGSATTIGGSNSFFGALSGITNTTGTENSFFGRSTGFSNSSGSGNSFFGPYAGFNTTTGNFNSMFGLFAGQSNATGDYNSFYGYYAGIANNTGTANSFFGTGAGIASTSGNFNTFLGHDAGKTNTTGANNTAVGDAADVSANNLTFATAIGSGTVVSSSNTVVLGRNLDTVQVPGALNVTGTFGANVLNATTQYNIGGSRVMSIAGSNNLFAGVSAGTVNTGSLNAFFGTQAGEQNTSGSQNSFFGYAAGASNQAACCNSFFGRSSGQSNTIGQLNSFVGSGAGIFNSTGTSNAFFGSGAGDTNTTGNNNTVIGTNADVATNNLSFATAIGANSVVSSSNTVLLGRNLDTVQIPGNLNLAGNFTGNFTVPASNITGVLGASQGGTGIGPALPTANTYLRSSGAGWTASGLQASDIPVGSGNYIQNSLTPQTASFNIAGTGRIGGLLDVNKNSSLAANDGQIKLTDPDNILRGLILGHEQTVTSLFSFIQSAPDGLGVYSNLTIQANGGNVGIGTSTPQQKLHVDANDEILSTGNGAGFKFRDRGSGSFLDDWVWYSSGNTARFFRAGFGDIMTFNTSGVVGINVLGSAGATTLCRNASNQISTCSSSLRYKTNIGQFNDGLWFVNKLRPISFDWKDGGMKDIGFGAEDIAKIDPRFVTYNDKGEVEGVKYDRLGVVLVNSVKEQQSQIEAQQRQIEVFEKQNQSQEKQIEALTQALCSLNPASEICKQKEQ